MMTGEGDTRTRSLIFWVMVFSRGGRRIDSGSTSSISVRPYPTKRAKRSAEEIRSWNLPLRSDKAIEDLSRMFNPKVRGWLQYYGRYYRSALYPYMRQLDRSLAHWAYRKYKKLRGHLRRGAHLIARISRRDSKLFGHWQMGVRRGSMAGAV